MKISVITVCFNSAATIGDTLRTVAEQTYSDVEHIIVDGGSHDETVRLAAAQLHSKGVIVSEADNGIYDAMNKGLRLATGDVIGFLNADDFYAGNWVLEQIAQSMASGIDAVFGDAEFVHPARLGIPVRRYRSARFHPSRLAWGWMPAHPTLYLRRELFERFGNFKSDYRIAGDFELVARMFHEGHLNYLYLPRVLVRMRTGGVSTGGFRNSLLLNREVLRACRENGISTNWPMLLSKYPAKLLEFLIKE
jgi:glycosyltransferase involved in cell wall biosynthesis